MPASNAGQAVLAAAAGNAGVELDQLAARKVGQLRDADLARRLDFFQRDRRHHAERVVANREIHRAGERMEQPRVGHQGDEAQRQDGVRPPQGEMELPGRIASDAGGREDASDADSRSATGPGAASRRG